MANYRFDQIHIGDEIYYEDRYVSNHFSSWRVTNKLDQSILIIEATDGDNKIEKRMIDFLEVRAFEVLSRK